ncbi:MAG: hypothetical protein WC373_11835 [Smithella sp.]|jgi:hypothetical protein
MTDLIVLYIALGAFAWGMLVQEYITKRRYCKAKEHRIVINAPFSPEQSDTIMRVLLELNDAVSKSTENERD